MEDGERTAAQYDEMGAAYAHDNETGSYNALYERPATIGLLGDVAGLRVLEIGCGPGALTAWLVDQGASVTAMDVSPAMVHMAAARLGSRATIVQADLNKPFTFVTEGSVDIIVASLVLHYVRDWVAALRQFRRALAPDGAVVFSTHHPAMDWRLHSPDDYFAVRQVTETWTKDGRPFEVTFWRRPLTAMTSAIASAGFVVERLVEPEPAAELQHRDPTADAMIRTNPTFLFFRLRPDRRLGQDGSDA